MRKATMLARVGVGAGAVALLVACEAPPTNMPRYWAGDSLHAPPSNTGGAGPGANGEGSGGAAGRVTAGSGGASGGKGGMTDEEEPDDVPSASGGAGGNPGGAMDARPADMGPASGDTSVPMGPAAGCQMTITVTTVTTNRDYAPRNVGVIWVADGTGKFVKSVAVWAGTRANYLRNWVMSTTAAGVPRNKVDAISSATVSNHRAHPAMWNCTDSKGALMPQGKYQLCMEMTEANATGAYRCVPFDHTGMAYETTLPVHARFIDNKITYAAVK